MALMMPHKERKESIPSVEARPAEIENRFARDQHVEYTGSMVMDTPSASIRNLARRLLTLEAALQPGAGKHVSETVRVFDKLRISVTRFAGADGFASLLRRSLALARMEVPSLDSIEVKPDCSLDGLEALAANEADGGVEALTVLAAHLLALLVTFIGEPLTLSLVREGWPDETFDS